MNTAIRTRHIVMTALMAALLAIVSPFTIPVGPVPLGLALFAVFFTGALLPPAPACAAVAVYILMGLAGLPVFSGFGAGPQVLVGPTGGYLAGYFLIALATALGVKYLARGFAQFLACLAGLAACYTLGTLWFMLVTGASFANGLILCVAPFALPDMLKAALALALARLVRKRLAKSTV